MATTAKEIVAYVKANTTGFEAGMRRVTGAAKGFKAAFAGVGRNVAMTASSIGSAMNRIGLAAAGMGVVIAKEFGAFEKTMLQAGAVTRTIVGGQMTDQFRNLWKEARRMGRETIFSARQAAEAIEVMGLAGLKTHEIIGALPKSLELAAAGNISIAQAADVAAKTMRAFGLEAKQLGRINDSLVATFTRANTDITQLGEALKHVAPVSKAFGVSIEDTTALIAKLSDAGFQGSIAGNSLRNIFAKLAGATPAATKKLANFGVMTTTVNGQMRPMIDILEDIENSAMSASDVLAIFGRFGGPQLLALLEQGMGGIRQFSAETTNMRGIAKEIAEVQRNSLWGRWKLILSQISDVLIEIGERLNNDMRMGLKEVSEAIEDFGPKAVQFLVETFRWLIQRIPDMIKGFQQLASTWGESAKLAWEWIKPIFEYLKNHPQLLSALIALKVTGLLGLNSVAVNLTRTLVSLVTTMATLRTASIATSASMGASGVAGAAQTATKATGFFAATAKMAGSSATVAAASTGRMAGAFASVGAAGKGMLTKLAALPLFWKVALVAAIGLAIKKLFTWLSGLDEAVEMHEDAMKSIAEADSELTEIITRNANDRAQAARDEANARRRADALGRTAGDLKTDLGGMSRNFGNTEKELAKAEAEVKRLGSVLTGGFVAGDPLGIKLRSAERLRDELQAQHDEEKARITELTQLHMELVQEEAEARNQAKKEEMQLARERREQLLKEEGEAARQGTHQSTKEGLQGGMEEAGMSDFIAEEVATGVERGMNDPRAQIEERLRQAEVGAKNENTPGFSQLESFSQMEGATGHDMGRFAMNEFGATAQMAGQFGARYDKAVAGGATQEQLDMMMQKFLDAVNQFNEATDTAKDSTARFKDSIAEVRDEFTEKFPRKMALLQKQLAPIAEKFLHLRKQLLEGKISSEDFEKAVEKLESSMKKAADTIETKLAPAVDNAASGRSRGGGANPYAGAGPAAYGRGPGGYSGNQNGGGGFGGQGFGGQSATGGAGYINPFDYGMRAGLMAQAQMLQSAIQALSSDRRWTMGTGKKNELKDQLEDVMNRLRNLKEKPPTFSGVNNALTGDDPALTGVDSGGGSRQVSMSFPNITRMTNADASKVMDMLDQEMRRRGTRL